MVTIGVWELSDESSITSDGPLPESQPLNIISGRMAMMVSLPGSGIM
jgi:hypothetical protein